MLVQGIERSLKLDREFQRVERGILAFFRHILADVLPEFPEHRHFIAGNIIGHRNTGQFDDAALDGIHEGKVAHGPWEQRTFHITGTAQEKRGCGKVEHAQDTDFFLEDFQTGNPETGCLAVVVGFFPGFRLFRAFESLKLFVQDFLRVLFLPVAVMRFIIDDHDGLEVHQFRHDTLEHLSFGLKSHQFGVAPTLERCTGSLGKLNFFSEFECVIIGDDNAGLLKVLKHIGRHKFPAGIIRIGVVGFENPQSVTDGDARRDNEKTLGESFSERISDGIQCLPCNEHGHDGGFSCTGGQFQGETREPGIGFFTTFLQVLQIFFLGLFVLRSHFGEPDGRFHSFYLAEERADAAKRMRAPMSKQTGCFRCDVPLTCRKLSPLFYLGPDLIDEGFMILLPL